MIGNHAKQADWVYILNKKWQRPWPGMRMELACFWMPTIGISNWIFSQWLIIYRNMHGHIFEVSKQIGLTYKFAILRVATLFNFLFSSYCSTHVGWSLEKYLEVSLKKLEKNPRNFMPKTLRNPGIYFGNSDIVFDN